MAELVLDSAQRRRSVAAAICITSVVGTAMGLTWPLLSLVLERQGVDDSLIGLSTTSQTLAIMVASPFAPRVIGRFGMVRTLYACTGVIVAALLLLPLYPDAYVWMPIRFALGAGAGILFIAGETWVNAVTTDAMRGRTIGVFGFLWAAGFGIGPLIIRATGIEGWAPFLAGIALIVAATLPLPFAGDVVPAINGRLRLPVRRLVRLAPAALLATALLGTLDAVNDSFLPLYGLRNGLDEDTAVTLLAVVIAGMTAVQIPIGWLADRFDRRALLRAMALGVLAVVLVLPLVIDRPVLVWPVAVALGASLGGIWAVSLVLIGERFQGEDLAAANAVRGVLYGFGAAAGPLLAGFAMEIWNPHGMLLVVVLGCLLYLPATLLRGADR